MQFTSVFTLLAVAMTASALPSEVARGNNIASCNAASQNVCCNGLLNCVVQVAGKTCNTEAYCCETTAPQVSANRTNFRPSTPPID
jgi:hypothetical protein